MCTCVERYVTCVHVFCTALLGFFLPVLVYIFVVAMCGGVDADVRSEVAL